MTTVFTEAQINELNDWKEKVTAEAAKRATEAVNTNDTSNLDGTFVEVSPELKKDQKKLNTVKYLWEHNGKFPGLDHKVTVEELLKKDVEHTRMMRDTFSTDHPLLTQRVISQFARDAIEPAVVLTGLLQRISYSAGTQLTFPSWGAIKAAHIPEGGEYPERSTELSGEITATIGKYGVAVKVSEEQIRYNQYDVMAAHMRAAGRALIRLKEENVADMLFRDNTNLVLSAQAGSAPQKVTGRNAAGAYNDTLTLDDLFYAFGVLVNNGFIPDTLIMHPFAWKIFAQEGIARAFGFDNANAALMWQAPSAIGSGKANQFRVGGLNQQTVVGNPANLSRTATNVPSIFPTGFKIVVTPFAPFTAGSTPKTDILLADSRELGVLVVDEDITTEEWNDPSKDLRKVKFRERYAVSAINNYKGVALFKDIAIKRSFDFADTLTHTPVNPTSPLTGDGY
jgi:hypothetical protein